MISPLHKVVKLVFAITSVSTILETQGCLKLKNSCTLRILPSNRARTSSPVNEILCKGKEFLSLIQSNASVWTNVSNVNFDFRFTTYCRIVIFYQTPSWFETYYHKLPMDLLVIFAIEEKLRINQPEFLKAIISRNIFQLSVRDGLFSLHMPYCANSETTQIKRGKTINAPHLCANLPRNILLSPLLLHHLNRNPSICLRKDVGLVHYPPRDSCHTNILIVSIIKHKLNFTGFGSWNELVDSENVQRKENATARYLNLFYDVVSLARGISREELHRQYLRYNVRVNAIENMVLRFMYCQERRPFLSSNWEIFLKPFRPPLWTAVFVSVLVMTIWVVCRKHLYTTAPMVFFELFAELLTSMPPRDVTVKLIIFSTLSFLVVSNLYLAALTSEFISSPTVQQFHTAQDLFGKNYKLMVESDYFRYAMGNFIGEISGKLGINWTQNDIIVWGYYFPNKTFLQGMLEKRAAYAVTNNQASELPVQFRHQRQVYHWWDSYECFLLDKKQTVYLPMPVLLMGSQNNEARKVFQKLMQSGIIKLWLIAEGRISNLNMMMAESESLDKEVPLPISSHIVIIFFVFLCMLGLALALLIWSLIMGPDSVKFRADMGKLFKYLARYG